ncbi:MAG: hypothetical protein VX278_08275 [Myxococcota bacterium]|nr:hypothetical protein [Myxococcota bacterium]
MLSLLALTLIQTVNAAAYDPKLTWRVLTTPHFNIHFHGGEEQLAEELATMAEGIYSEMSTELQWNPSLPTQVVLLDNTDSANGYATYLPMNTIVIYVTAPEGDSTLSLYEDWNDAIFTHELTHILHLDTVSGIPAAFRTMFGKIIALNGLAPAWVIEGQATLQETRHTNAGRGRASLPDMIKRTAVLEDDFPHLGNLDGFQLKWPRGNLRYLFGQDFMQYISDQKGENVWTDWNHLYGGGIPYLLPEKAALGDSLPNLYEAWKEHTTKRYTDLRDELERYGLTEFTPLSPTDQNCMGARISPNGEKMIYSCNAMENGSAIYLANADGSDPRVEKKLSFSKYFSWRKDSKAIAYSSSRTVNRFNLYYDVYLKELGGRTQMLTRGKRARDPAFSPEGEQLLFVTNKAQNNQLATLTIDQTIQNYTNNTDHTQYSHPRYSPDGEQLAVSVWQGGRRDLWIYSKTGVPQRRITQDIALDIHPTWSADGQYLYFSSDRTGIFNIFAIELASETLYQVTNVLTGAFAPSPAPNGEQLVFTYYHKNGFGIASMPIEKSEWKRWGSLPAPLFYDMPLRNITPLSTPWISTASESPSPPPSNIEPSTPGSSGQNPATIQNDLFPYEGLTDRYDPFYYLKNEKGYWGLPHESMSWSEGPTDGPNIDEELELSELENREEEEFQFSHPLKRYNPIQSLLPPRFIAPGVYRTFYGLQFAAGTSGVDILRRHLYSAAVDYRTDSGYIGWGFGYAYNRFIPIFSFGIQSYTVPYGTIYTYNPPDSGAWVPSISSTNTRYWDKRTRGYAQVSYAIDPLRSIFARWTGTFREPWISANSLNVGGFPIHYGNRPLPENAYRPLLPTRGFLSSIGGGWRYVRGRSFTKSISPEDTRLVSIVGEIHSPYLGSFVLNDEDEYEPFSQLQLTAEWREYRTVPWAHNHVLALKLAGGIGAGSIQRYGAYRLGGSFGESGYYTLPDEWRALRGYTSASRSGNSFYLGAAEYRLPLMYIDRGIQSYPIFFRNISGAFFVDFGHAFDDFSRADIVPMVGMGAEISARIAISWGQGLTIRSGYAFSPMGDGIPFGSNLGFYSWLGSSF